MIERSHAFYAWATFAVMVIAVTIIIVTGHTVPEGLWILAGVNGGGAAGISHGAAIARTRR